MWLAVVIDIIAISPRIAVILPITDYSADDTAKYRTSHRAGSCANPWKHRSSDCAGSRPNCRACCAAGHDMISVGVARTTAKRQARCHGS